MAALLPRSPSPRGAEPLRSRTTALALSLSAAILGSALAAGCNPPEPAAPKTDAATPGASSTSATTPSTATVDTTAPAPSGPSAPATPAATSTGTTAAPAASRALETAVQTKTTSAGGSYAVGTVSASGIAEADVIQVLNNAASKTDACYVPLFKKQLAAVGRTTFELEIDAAGKTKSVSQKENETKDDKLAKCLEGVLKKLTWPAPTKAPAKATAQWIVKGN